MIPNHYVAMNAMKAWRDWKEEEAKQKAEDQGKAQIRYEWQKEMEKLRDIEEERMKARTIAFGMIRHKEKLEKKEKKKGMKDTSIQTSVEGEGGESGDWIWELV